MSGEQATGQGATAAAIRWVTSPLGAIVCAVATIAVIAFIALSGGDDESSPDTAAPNPPEPVTAAELSSLSRSLGRPVYWAGGRPGERYELTRMGEERIAVRYPLRTGSDPAQGSLTVATYRLDDAAGAIRRAARSDTARTYRLPGGGLAVQDRVRPTNTYLAYAKEPYQVEVFDPKPGRALRLVLDGRVRPVP